MTYNGECKTECRATLYSINSQAIIILYRSYSDLAAFVKFLAYYNRVTRLTSEKYSFCSINYVQEPKRDQIGSERHSMDMLSHYQLYALEFT